MNGPERGAYRKSGSQACLRAVGSDQLSSTLGAFLGNTSCIPRAARSTGLSTKDNSRASFERRIKAVDVLGDHAE